MVEVVYDLVKMRKILKVLVKLDDNELKLLAKSINAYMQLKAERNKKRNTDADDTKETGWATMPNGSKVCFGENDKVEKGPSNMKGKTISQVKKEYKETGKFGDGSLQSKSKSSKSGSNGSKLSTGSAKLNTESRFKVGAYKKYKEAAEAKFKGLLPKDSKYASGTNYKGESRELAIQGKEFQELYNKLNKQEMTVEELSKNPAVQKLDEVSKKVTKAVGYTNLIDTPERQELRDSIKNDFLSTGAAREYTDEKGRKKYAFDGEVKKEFKCVIYTGLPAAGKSTAVNPLSEKEGMFIFDNDVIKGMIPEFEATGGAAANAVHKESGDIQKAALKEFLGGSKKGCNLAIPTIGDDAGKIYDKFISRLEEAGYDVEVRGIEASPDTSSSRVITRAIETGRIIPSETVLDYGNGCDTAYDEMKNMTGKNGKPYVREKQRFKA